MFKIFCDETWTSQSEYKNVQIPYIVFYGIMLEQSNEELILQKIESFKRQRGLFSTEKNAPIEIKWQKVEEEWKSSKRASRSNRYEDFLNIFFEEARSKRISFGYMFMEKDEYDSREKEFLKAQSDNRQNFFFMLYFQFLYHCFIKNQIKQQPYEVWIDNHDMGSEGQQYEIGRLKDILNKRIYKDNTVKDQMWLSDDMKKKLVDSTRLVSLASSKDEPLVQLSDLCAGCIRYILENEISPPNVGGQISMFDSEQPKELVNGKDSLVDYFYRNLRKIKGYGDINLLNISYHHRFSIFPFTFKQVISPTFQPLVIIEKLSIPMTANRPLRVFLCHSSNDKPAALKGDELYQKLRAEPWIQPWLDEEELYPGQDWNMEIEKSIEFANVSLFD